MLFAHYEEPIPYDALAENLVNSHDLTLPQPEHLAAPADLDAFLKHHRVPAARKGTEADLRRVRLLRKQLRDVFEAGTRTKAAARLNRLLAGAPIELKVQPAQDAAALEFSVTRSDDLPATLQAAVALSLAFALERFGFDRLGVCQ